MEILSIPCICTPTDRVELNPCSDSRLMITTHDEMEGAAVMLNVDTAKQLAEALINWVNEQ